MPHAQPSPTRRRHPVLGVGVTGWRRAPGAPAPSASREPRGRLLLGRRGGVREIEGGLATTVGYTGGETTDPSYEQVCGNRTGHAQAVEI